MVDTYDLFKKLSKGTTYRKMSIIRELEPSLVEGSPDQPRDQTISSALDFFGDLKTSSHSADVDCPRNTSKQLGTSSTSKLKGSRKRKVVETEPDVCSDADIDSDCEVDEGMELVAGQPAIKMTKNKTKKKGKRKKKRLDKVAKETLRRQEINAFRNTHRIYLSGADIPEPVSTFEELKQNYSLPAYIMKNINSVGYLEPTPIQMQGIPLMLQGRELVACAPTGSGKTAAFIIPILAHLKTPKKVGFRAVVVSPTRELAQQTYREFCRLTLGSGFKVHVLTKAKANASSFGPQSSQRFDILITTPNRLVHLLSQQPLAISLHNVEWLILDEADKLFEDGELGFRDQVAQIYSSCDHPNVKHALLSATLASGVEEFSHTHFDNPVRVIIGLPNSAADSVKQELLFVGQECGKLLAMRDLIRKGFTPPVLVFVQSKERAKELFQELIYDGLNVDLIHSERTQAQRDNVVKCFRSGKIWVLICTDLMGRGIDFKGVNMVINYDCPPSAISYIHRIGRTGRAGHSGQAVTFFTEADSINLRSIANVMVNSGCTVPEWMLQIKKPSKNTRKQLSKVPLVREDIRTVSRYDLQRSKKRKEMISGSKRRKTELHGQ